MGLTPLDFFVKARFSPVAAAVLVIAVACHVLARRRLAARGRPWAGPRSASFAAACAAYAVAEFSGLDAFARTNFSAYAAQYILAGLVAPLLLAFSAPLTMAIRSSTSPARGSSLRSVAARVVAGPVATFVAFAATLFVVFFTGVAGAGIGDGLVQDGIAVWMLAAGWLFFWPVVAVDPLPWPIGYWPRILYLLLSFPIFAILGMGLESQSGRIAPGVSPASLHLGAAVIWVAGEAAALGGVIAVFAQWLRADERRARRLDEANAASAERQLALWRASRDAAARAGSN